METRFLRLGETMARTSDVKGIELVFLSHPLIVGAYGNRKKSELTTIRAARARQPFVVPNERNTPITRDFTFSMSASILTRTRAMAHVRYVSLRAVC